MSIRPSAHPRLSWSIFGVTCALALGAALVASLASGGRTNLGMTFLGGAVVIGIAAALMYAIISPMPDSASAAFGPRGGFADAGGVSDGGGGGGFSDGGSCD